jgi:Tol biopolymer transport system component
VIEITDGSTVYMQPVWSPDGKKLAFTTSGFTGVYVRNADGSGPIREVTSADYSGYKPLWTRDSKALILRTRTGLVGQSITSIDMETGEVKTIVERAAHPGQPDRNAYGDVTINIDGEREILNTETGSIESMDSYYSAERPSSFDITLEIDFRNRRMWIVEGDGTRRSAFPHPVLLATLSPMRDRVAFGKADPNLYVSNLDGSSIVNLGPGESWDWSPDGQRIVYLSAIHQNEWTMTGADIFVANADGSKITQLTDTPEEVESYPVWSPDGAMIAYSTVNTGKICVAFLEEVR